MTKKVRVIYGTFDVTILNEPGDGTLLCEYEGTEWFFLAGEWEYV